MKSRLKLSCALLSVALLWACATKTGTGALVGAGAGAGVGAGIGALAGGKKGALIGGALGAGAGAITGAAIGRYMDNQEKALKENVKGANVERQGDKLVIRFNSAILFDTNKAKLKPASEGDLGELAKVLTQYPETTLIVEGHTDSTGKKKKNMKLSQDRAQSVVVFLTAKGVAQERLTAQGFADEKPVGDNKTKEGRAANRRVEIQINAIEKLKQQDAQQAQQPTQGS